MLVCLGKKYQLNKPSLSSYACPNLHLLWFFYSDYFLVFQHSPSFWKKHSPLHFTVVWRYYSVFFLYVLTSCNLLVCCFLYSLDWIVYVVLLCFKIIKTPAVCILVPGARYFEESRPCKLNGFLCINTEVHVHIP